MEELIVELENPSASYFAGQKVLGRLVLKTDKPLQYTEIVVRLHGTGNVHWSGFSTPTNYEKSKYRTFSESEQYFIQIKSLAGDPNYCSEISQGIHTYPFEFHLSKDCPSSFNTRKSCIAYFLHAEIRREDSEQNKFVAVPITVNGYFDLNAKAVTSEPQELEKVKGTNFLVNRKGRLSFILRLPRSGYVPGEILDFFVTVTNNSNKHVQEMKAILRQNRQYFTYERETDLESKVICQVKGPEVHSGSVKSWAPNSLRIPPVPPTGLGGKCGIIDVKYFLDFEVDVSGLSSKLSGELPVLIGTIPLRNRFDELRNLQTTAEKFGKSFAFDLPDYPDLPPPAYEEAVLFENFSWNSKKHSNANPLTSSSQYIPNYITYNKK